MASIAVENFGGNGYIEDWPMERQLRDAQNHPIWEGTQLVLSMDVVRAAPKSLPTIFRILSEISEKLKKSPRKSQNLLGGILDVEIESIRSTATSIPSSLSSSTPSSTTSALSSLSQTTGFVESVLPSAAKFASMLADTLQFAFLCEQALWASTNLQPDRRHQHQQQQRQQPVQQYQFRSFIVAALFARNYFVSRDQNWARALSGGYPKTRKLFYKLVHGDLISEKEAEESVVEILARPAKL